MSECRIVVSNEQFSCFNQWECWIYDSWPIRSLEMGSSFPLIAAAYSAHCLTAAGWKFLPNPSLLAYDGLGASKRWVCKHCGLGFVSRPQPSLKINIHAETSHGKLKKKTFNLLHIPLTIVQWPNHDTKLRVPKVYLDELNLENFITWLYRQWHTLLNIIVDLEWWKVNQRLFYINRLAVSF